ncbi:hypothetical protein DRO54_11335 [Candidatus Bathyarchaeota archaeon]|nr:MAG: hypothetical protein DRO54_11335 [Candidatus Bathyarchaeota archaeon]
MSHDEILKKYVANIEEACGEEKDIIIMLKHEGRDEALKKILGKVKVVRSLANIAYDADFEGKQMRIYRTGKILMKKLKDKREAEDILKKLLS